MYAYPDIVFAKSTDKGLTFTAPVSVSPQPAGLPAQAATNFSPASLSIPSEKWPSVTMTPQRQHQYVH